ncbi:MAG: DUF885 family protein [bacterium]
MRQLFRSYTCAVALGLVWFMLTLNPGARAAENDAEKFRQLLQDQWEFTLRENPLLATSRGDLRYNDRLGDASPAAFERRNRANQAFMQRLEAIDRERLSAEDQLNYDLFKEQLRWSLEEYKFGTFLEPVHQRSGFQLFLPRMHERIPLKSKKQYEDYLARLRAVPTLIDQNIALLKKGLKRGITPPRLVLEAVPQQLATLAKMPVADFPLFQPFKSFPETIDAATQKVLAAKGKQLLEEQILPTFDRFKRFFQESYIPNAKRDIAVNKRHPDGSAFYAYRVKRFTTTDLTPKEIHAIGHREVARIRKRMLQIIQETDFQGSFAEFVTFLRTDDRFYFTDAEDLVLHYRDICKRMDAELPRLFGKLPRAPYGVREIPQYEAPRATTAYYNGPTADGTQPGWFYVNTYDLKSRPKYEMEALSFHESVPGHHLQIALQQELENVPPFRTMASFTAFVEGWGLYAESLGQEAGFYRDPYSEFGFLSYQMWRALRLVVDTGIHAFGWSREKAINYMLENSALTRTNVENEVDRYIAWPGQALAYKIGQMKIWELRKRAQKALGEAFDLRAFHDLVLSAGAIPLSILEQRVDAWIEKLSQS